MDISTLETYMEDEHGAFEPARLLSLNPAEMDALQEKRETDVASMTNQVLEEMVSPRKTDDWRRRVINALRHTINELKSLAYMRGHVRADLDSAGSSAIATAFLEEACETLDDETLRRLRKGALQRLNHSNGITHE